MSIVDTLIESQASGRGSLGLTAVVGVWAGERQRGQGERELHMGTRQGGGDSMSRGTGRSKERVGKIDARSGNLEKLSSAVVLYQLWRGFQLLDAFLCCPYLHIEHSAIWLATIFLGCSFSSIGENTNSTYWKSEDDAGGMAGLAGDVDSHPYVCFTINLI
ncbi:hypothetical protein NE237_007000 [Protea cynaroides]|uniref:Uncharacterized protein n=1 Tax=Protea cynaroides TaxID=273540 RepID=A0A9Q0KNL4_9MAGN|nr:hypothetical protein NE237_007000 [Protea cynaroides]